eukprot:COSAG04_NODE_1591_length_6214_cov_29.260095_5_plen_172_part_00
MPPGAQLRPNPDCDTFSAVSERVGELDAACPGAPEQCSPSCGAALLPFLDVCGSFIDALNVFDDADGSHDDRAGVFYQLRESCLATPSGQILERLQPLWASGQCPTDWMEDVSATAVQEAACADARGEDSCKGGILNLPARTGRGGAGRSWAAAASAGETAAVGARERVRE